MMKRTTLLAALCGVTLLAGCNQEVNQAVNQAADAENAGRSAILPPTHERNAKALSPDVLLTVNGEPVTKAMYGLFYNDRVKGKPAPEDAAKLQMAALNELANVLILTQDAVAKKLDQQPEVQATLTLLRAKLLTQIAIQDYLKKHQPDEAAIKKQYETDYAGKSTLEYRARHILVKTEDEAKDLIKQLDEGADFAELARQHSTGPTGKNGGDLGWFDAAQMVKPFSDQVRTMQAGNYTKTPVKTQFGWHVILLEETRDVPPPSLEEVRSDILTSLQQKALADYIQGLRAKSKLEFNELAASKGSDEKPAAEKE